MCGFPATPKELEELLTRARARGEPEYRLMQIRDAWRVRFEQLSAAHGNEVRQLVSAEVAKQFGL